MSTLCISRHAAVCLLFLLAGAASARAGAFVVSGTLDPAANPNLAYWDQMLDAYAPPIGGPTDAERAVNIALHTFSVAVAGPVQIASQGYGLGGFDSVVSLFEGSGNAAAYVQHAFSPFAPGDFDVGLNLAAGMYTLGVSMFGSEPCASGLCMGATGVLGDGFNNLVNYDGGRSLAYHIEVTTTPVPEPGSAALLMTGVAALLARKRLQRGARGTSLSD